MTKQEYFDRLKAAATDGTFPSVDRPYAWCRYRLDRRPKCPQRCAAGLLIPDEKYTPEMEGDLLSPEILAAIEIPEGMDIRDIKAVQHEHDFFARQPEWKPAKFISRISQLSCFADVQK